MNKLLEEKDEHISHLQERVSTLEQRVQDVGLSEDERIKALENEVTSYEQVALLMLFARQVDAVQSDLSKVDGYEPIPPPSNFGTEL